MERTSGRSILYTMLRESKGEPVSMKAYAKELKSQGRTVNAFPRVLYWVSKEIEKYGYDIETTTGSDGEITSMKLVKADHEPTGPGRPPNYNKPAKKAKKVKKSKTSKKSKIKPVSKKKKSKTSKKRREETESDEAEESSSEEESTPDESEEDES